MTEAAMAEGMASELNATREIKRGTEKPSVWFLPDVPVDDAATDAFGHTDVAGNLLSMVRSPQRGRLLIGLIGAFGVGKSTVIELLRSLLAGDKDRALIRVSAERHEMEDFHRSFVFSVAEQLVDSQLLKPDDASDLLEPLEFVSTQSRVDPTLSPVYYYGRRVLSQVASSTLKRSLLVAGFIAAIIVVVSAIMLGMGVFGEEPARAFFAWLGSIAGTIALLLTVPIVISVWSVVKKSANAAELFKSGQSARTRPRADAADEYERTFARLIDQIDQRLIIAVDDIDRMAASDILSALNAIRTFQLTARPSKRPILIVSVDERIVAEALQRGKELSTVNDSRERVVEEFLNRLFVQRQQMPPHAGPDLKSYARRLLADGEHAGAKKLGHELEGVLNVLVHDGVRDPRHVIRLLNAFFGDYRLAYRREQQDVGRRALTAGVVTASPRALARMVVFRVDFPRFFEILKTDLAALDLIEGHVRGSADEDAVRGLQASIGAVGSDAFVALTRFVGRTATWTEDVDDLLPFIYLGQDEIERTLGSRDARLIRSVLANRQISELRDVLTRLSSETDERKAGMFQLIVETLQSLESLELNNAIEALAEAADLIQAFDPRLADAIAESMFRTGTARPDVGGLVTLASQVSAGAHARRISEAIVRLPELDVDEWIRILLTRRGELRNLPAIGIDVYELLTSFMQSLAQAKSNASLESLLPALTHADNDDLAAVALESFLTVAASEEDDITDEVATQISHLFATLNEGSLPEGILSLARKTLASDGTTVITKAVLDGLKAAKLTNAEQLAVLTNGFVRGTIRDKEAVREGFDHKHFAPAADLLTATVDRAPNWTVGKRRILTVISELLAACVTSWETTYPDMNDIASAISDQSATDMAPLYESFFALVRSVGKELDADEQALFGLLVEHTDDVQKTTAEVVRVGFETALGPVADATVRTAAIGLVPALFRAKAAEGWADDYIQALDPYLTRTSPEPTASAVLALITNTQISPSSEATIFNAVSGKLIPYGGDALAAGLELLVNVAWSEALAPSAMGLVTQFMNQLTDYQIGVLVSRSASFELGALPQELTEFLFQSGHRIAAKEPSRAQSLAALARHLDNTTSLEYFIGLGENSEPQFASWLAGINDMGFYGSAAQVIASSPSTSDWCVRVTSAIADEYPDHFGDGVDDLLVGQIFEDDDAYPTDTWVVLISASPTGILERIVGQLQRAWTQSAKEVTASLPIVRSVSQSNEFDVMLAQAAADALRRWVREESDATVARDLARAIHSGKASRAAALTALGRSPRNEPAKSAHASAKAALTVA